MSSLRNRNLAASHWNLFPQLFMHASRTWKPPEKTRLSPNWNPTGGGVMGGGVVWGGGSSHEARHVSNTFCLFFLLRLETAWNQSQIKRTFERLMVPCDRRLSQSGVMWSSSAVFWQWKMMKSSSDESRLVDLKLWRRILFTKNKKWSMPIKKDEKETDKYVVTLSKTSTSIIQFTKIQIHRVLCTVSVLQWSPVITHSDGLQRLLLLRRLDFMSKKANGDLWTK